MGVLTNNPPFPQQMFQLNNYMHLYPKQPENLFCKKLDLTAYSRGMDALGLPGDLSSASRFVRVAFTKINSISGDSEKECVSQFFHILGSVNMHNENLDHNTLMCYPVFQGLVTLTRSCLNFRFLYI